MTDQQVAVLEPHLPHLRQTSTMPSLADLDAPPGFVPANHTWLTPRQLDSGTLSQPCAIVAETHAQTRHGQQSWRVGAGAHRARHMQTVVRMRGALIARR